MRTMGPQGNLKRRNSARSLTRDLSTEADSGDEDVDPVIKPAQKRRKFKHDNTSDIKDMKELMVLNEERRAKFEGKIVEALEASTAVYERTQDNFLKVLIDKLN